MTDRNARHPAPEAVQICAQKDPKRRLFERQKTLLDTFLGTGAITPAQYRKSLTCLAEKMGFPLSDPLP